MNKNKFYHREKHHRWVWARCHTWWLDRTEQTRQTHDQVQTRPYLRNK